MGYIYKIENKILQEVYIGQTTQSFEDRIKQHIISSRKMDSKLYIAMREYGLKNFKASIVGIYNNELLNRMESYFIGFYDSFIHGYNSNRGRNIEIYNEVRASLQVYDIYKNHLKHSADYSFPETVAKIKTVESLKARFNLTDERALEFVFDLMIMEEDE